MGATRAGGATAAQGPGPAAPQRTERPKPASKPLDSDGPDHGMKAPIMSAPRAPGNHINIYFYQMLFHSTSSSS